MNLTVTAETERLIEEEMRSGRFRSVDELIVSGIHAWREKNGLPVSSPPQTKSLVEFFRTSPLVGLELDFERDQDTGRDLVL